MLLKAILYVYPYVFFTSIMSILFFLLYANYVLFMYVNPTDRQTSIHNMQTYSNNNSLKNKKINYKRMLKDLFEVLTGIIIIKVIYGIIETELFLHNKKSTCFIYREIKELIES